LGSKNGVIEKPVLQKEGMNLTAVTVAVENGHTVAFLGTSDGKILKVTNQTLRTNVFKRLQTVVIAYFHSKSTWNL